MACDMCGNKEKPLNGLRDIYKTDDIQQVCPDCIAEVNIHLDKLRSIDMSFIQLMLKRFMKNKKSEITTSNKG